MCEQRTGIALHARGDEQGRFLTQPLCSIGFQILQGRVITEYVVAHDCICHCIAHSLCRLGHGITPQINVLHDRTSVISV